MNAAEHFAKAEQCLGWSKEEDDHEIATLHALQANAHATLAVAASQLRSLTAAQAEADGG